MKNRKPTTQELILTLLREGKIVERNFSVPYSIVEAFGQRYRIENPSGKKPTITQLPNVSKS